MKYIHVVAFMYIGAVAFAQEVHYDYHRAANFGSYKTYRWVDYRPVDVGDQLLDQDVKRAVDAQLAAKGLRRVDAGGDLLVGYQAAVSQEKQYDSFGWGGSGLLGAFGNWGDTRVTTSTIEVGKLVIGLFDPAANQLVWRGSASKTLDIRRDPDKNFRVLERAVAKLFRNYPPGSGKS